MVINDHKNKQNAAFNKLHFYYIDYMNRLIEVFMPSSKIDMYVVIAIFLIVVGIVIASCSADDTVSASQMYEKCLTVNADSTNCEQNVIIYK